MNDKPCSRENAIAHAVSSNQWSEELRLHIAQCERCAEVGEVSLWMNRVAESWDTPEPICDPGLIWLKAQREEEQRLRMMALRPVLITHNRPHINIKGQAKGYLFIQPGTQSKADIADSSMLVIEGIGGFGGSVNQLFSELEIGVEVLGIGKVHDKVVIFYPERRNNTPIIERPITPFVSECLGKPR